MTGALNSLRPHAMARPHGSATAALGFCAALVCAALSGCAGGGVAAVDTQPSNNTDAANINVQLGLDYMKEGDLQLAQTKLDRALREDSHNANVYLAMALLDARLGKAKDADRDYHRALALSHRSALMLNDYAVYLCSHGRSAEGVRYADEAAANPLYQTPWAAYANAGICLQNLHRDAEALQRFTRALQSNPTFADAVFGAASVEFAQQRYLQARLRVDGFLIKNPPTPQLLLLAWRIAGAQGDTDGQQRYRQRLNQEFPDSGQARALQIAAERSAPVD
ncbi:MAG TPA: type IV pilus biogenesis/stability protein PilW [Steroidobacteraceae bacterium]|nr:type IV pilus biogenesis/stability protein PilW [Steroidobacteraceae bacterium]